MIRIKNLRPSRLFISDAGLKLLPGQVASVDSLSPQTEGLIARGYVARLSDDPKEASKTEDLPAAPAEYDDLYAPEAIEYIEKVSDPQILRAILKEEKRKTVIEAINQRLGELDG